MILTLSMAITFASVAFVYEAKPSNTTSTTGGSTDIGRWEGSGNSTASIKVCTRNQAFLGACCLPPAQAHRGGSAHVPAHRLRCPLAVWINGHLVATGQECDLDFLTDHRFGEVRSRSVHIDAVRSTVHPRALPTAQLALPSR